VIICLCRGVSAADVRRVLAAGACSAEAITAACGAGGDCGACTVMLADLVAESEAALICAGSRA
jgi:bacterioferritin-associated ferredoxin